MKYWWITLLILGLFPYTFIISLLAFYYRAIDFLGYYPSYGHPDPKELAIYDDYNIVINLSFIAWISTIVIWLILVGVYVVKNRKNLNLTPVIVTYIGQQTAVILLFSTIFDWYID